MWKFDCSKIYYFVFMMSISYYDMHYILFCISVKRKSYNLTALTEIEEKNDDNSNTLLEIAIIY